MIPRPLGEITGDDLEQLVADQVHEGRSLDYKRDLSLSNDKDKKELARDVSSLANAGGGDLVIGAQEARDNDGKNLGYPEKVLGVDCPNFDDTKQRIESIVRDNIDPRVHGLQVQKVDGFERGPVIIVRVPRSWNAPHMVSIQNQSHFYSRNSAGKYPLDVREIKAAFLAGTEQAEHVRRFRDGRLGRIIAGETPVAMALEGWVAVVLHVVPLGTDRAPLDVVALGKEPARLPPPWTDGGWSHRFNLDGFVTYSGPNQGPQFSYLQVFRNGAFEAVFLKDIDDRKQPHRLWPMSIESAVVTTAAKCLAVLRDAAGALPVSVSATLLGAKGTRLQHGDWEHPWDRDKIIDRDPLILPDVLDDGGEPDPTALLRPMFDALWQSSGWERSYGYDEDGTWRADLHR